MLAHAFVAHAFVSHSSVSPGVKALEFTQSTHLLRKLFAFDKIHETTQRNTVLSGPSSHTPPLSQFPLLHSQEKIKSSEHLSSNFQ